MDAFSCPFPTMSKDCTRGTPDAIIVAIWRENIAMSIAVIGGFLGANSGLGLVFIFFTLNPCLRSSAFAIAELFAIISPSLLTPF